MFCHFLVVCNFLLVLLLIFLSVCEEVSEVLCGTVLGALRVILSAILLPIKSPAAVILAAF